MAILKFQELGGEVALVTAASTSTRHCKEFSSEGTCKLAVTSLERNGRGDEETFKVVDDTTTERAIELHNRGLAIHNEVAKGSIEGLDV